MKRYLLLALIAVAVTVVINLVLFMLQSPDAKDRQAIADCWDESPAANLTPVQQQIVIGACQALEKAYQLNHGSMPGRKEV